MAKGIIPKNDGTEYKVIEQYTQSNFTQMELGSVVMDYYFGLYWTVISNDGNCVTLKETKLNDDGNGVTTNLHNGEFINTFCLLEEV